MKTALITGISGQDGRYLYRLLQEKCYRVVGTSRDPERALGVLGTALETLPEVLPLDPSDELAVQALLDEVKPDELYNLAAYAVGSTMWDEPGAIGEINGVAVAHFLEAIRKIGLPVRFFQASSSEMYGATSESPQIESSPFLPRSPYGAAKLYAHNLVRIYREHHGLFACSAIFYNHESPARSLDFVTRKVTQFAAKISLGLARELPLGNIEARRDWGYAGDYMAAAFMMLQHHEPGDYVVATGKTHSVAELCEIAFSYLGLDYHDYVVASNDSWRPSEAVQLLGDSTRLRETLHWTPHMSFRDMIHEMVDHDLYLLNCEADTR